MGYRHILNFYKDQRILTFSECYCLEKIHGTSAHISYNNGEVRYFSGGSSYDLFCACFDNENLKEKFKALNLEKIIIYGEAYGGKLHKMASTYGPSLKFVAFDVRIPPNDESDTGWYDVPVAKNITEALGLDFVSWNRVSVTSIDAQRDLPSRQATKNGMGNDKISEGVVIRPIHETIDYRGNRIITKHKRAEFSERTSGADTILSVADRQTIQKILISAVEIAHEWATPERLRHVLDHIQADLQREVIKKDIPRILESMCADIIRESAGEIVITEAAITQIKKNTVQLFLKGV
jgi:hypothetical protein